MPGLFHGSQGQCNDGLRAQVPLPGLAITAVMAGILNPWLVGLVGGVAQALGELTGYMAGYSSQTWVDENPTYDRLARRMRHRGLLTVSALAAIPNAAFDLAGIAAAKRTVRGFKPSDVIGIGVAGMPAGSPGMEIEGFEDEAFDVVSFDEGGVIGVYASYPGQ